MRAFLVSWQTREIEEDEPVAWRFHWKKLFVIEGYNWNHLQPALLFKIWVVLLLVDKISREAHFCCNPVSHQDIGFALKKLRHVVSFTSKGCKDRLSLVRKIKISLHHFVFIFIFKGNTAASQVVITFGTWSQMAQPSQAGCQGEQDSVESLITRISRIAEGNLPLR